ncbi:MAG: hypothetical protein ACE5G2_08225 [Candidatus Krumholzibacteriia bacterium]
MRSTIRILGVILVAAPAAAGEPANEPSKQDSQDSSRLSSLLSEADSTSTGRLGTEFELPQQVREKKYFYSSFGTRDPFRPLVGGDFEPKLQELVDLHTVQLVGVLWEMEEHVAMVQDSQGFGYGLRPGDRVRNGTVVSVTQDALVARLNVFGQTTRVTLRLHREE